MKPKYILVILITGLFLSFNVSMSVLAGPPEPTKTRYLKTTGAGISIDRSTASLYYAMNYQIRKDLKAPLYVTIEFQNPENDNTPFIQYEVFESHQKVFAVESPTFKRIRNNYLYEVLIEIYDDEERNNLISTHSQQVHFSIPEKLAPNLGIELME